MVSVTGKVIEQCSKLIVAEARRLARNGNRKQVRRFKAVKKMRKRNRSGHIEKYVVSSEIKNVQKELNDRLDMDVWRAGAKEAGKNRFLN